MVKTIAPDLSETLYTPIGSELTITDPANRKTMQKKDAFGRLTALTEDPGGPLQSTTYYRYSVQDDLLAVCQGGVFSGATCVGGKERTFRYDSLRRLASATNPESGETLYTYDDAGNLTTKRDGNMISVNTTYDAIQRPLVRTYSDGTTPEVTYTWDQATLNGIGRMNRVANSVSTTDYLEFDAMGRVLKSRQTTNTTPYNFEYQYNLAGGMSLEKYPSLREVRSCYDEAGRISQVKQKANATAPETVVANLTGYAPHGAVTGMTLGASLVTESTLHDPKRLQVQQLTASTVAAGNWQMNLYYCAGESLLCTTNNGNIVRQKGYGGAAWDYSYDSLNRLELTTEKVGTVDKWQQRMKYDPFGNRWILNEAGTLIPNLEATPRAQLASDPSPFTTKNQWNGASYDPGGNQTTTWGDGTAVGAAKYSYDAENRIKKAEVNWPAGGAGVVEHGYDGDGRRIWKKVGGVVKTTFVYNASGQLVAEYGESAAMPCTTCYLTADHLGSTRVVWGSDGAMKQLLDYAPFGEEVGANYRGGDVRYPGGLYPRPGGMGVSMEFTGKERDAETGLDYFGARYMSATQGRFTSPDPIILMEQKLVDPQQWNMYSYVRNNPLRLIDPTGMYVCSGTQSECKDFEKERQKALKSKDSDVVSGASAYGDAGKDNGVSVRFVDSKSLRKNTAGNASASLEVDPSDPSKLRAKVDVQIKQGQSGVDLRDTIAHEGIHTRDAQAFAATATMTGQYDLSKNLTVWETEMNAYAVSAAVLAEAGQTRQMGTCGGGPCIVGPGMNAQQVRGTSMIFLANPANGYNRFVDVGGQFVNNLGMRQFPAITTPAPKP
jgi:RHS repeat-associated protein